ncbi:MAG: hypothetical protein BGO40_12175 [Chryseobacterium sp. 39-10]|nr:MAG: hypothetical protein BGO40_12175 [Chryseobacterium sp. 39-10]
MGWSQQITKVEYWFNNDFAGRVQTDVSVNGNYWTDFDIPFPDNGTNEFYETVYFRFKDGSNNWSPIQSKQLFDANDPYLYPVQVQYWFDDGFSDKTITDITGQINEQGAFEQAADIAWKPKAQTVFYRFKSKYNQWTAVQKSNIDQMPNVNPKIDVAEYWRNDDFANRKTTIILADNSFYLDIRDLDIDTENPETIHLRYRDKMHRWTPVYSFRSDYQGDEIEPTPTGAINLAVNKMAGGKVQLTWNSVTNGKLYMLYRDGIYWRSLENSHHPQTLEAVDFPPLGTHSYYVMAKNYLNPNSVTSNTVNTAISQEDLEATVQYGTLSGIITDENGNRIDDVEVMYSHDNYTVYSNLGAFEREGIPYGTEGTISLSKYGYTFTPETVSAYHISEPLQTLVFTGTYGGGSGSSEENNQDYKLEQTKPFTLITLNPQYRSPFEVKTTVKNIKTTPWSGKLQLIAQRLYSSNDEPLQIISEIQVTNLGEGKEQILEFVNESLRLYAGSYSLKIRTYVFEDNINCTIQDVKIGDNILILPITVGNEFDWEELSDVMETLRLVFKGSRLYTQTLIVKNGDEMLNEILGKIRDGLEVQEDYVEKANKIIAAVNHVNNILGGNDFKDYWKALSGLTEYCGSEYASFCKIINMYMDVSSQALEAIDKIENLTYSGHANFNFMEGAKLRMKIYKQKNLWNINNSYYPASDFINQIQSASFIGVDSSGTIKDDIPLSKVVCNDPINSETMCLVPPYMDNYYMQPSYKYLVKIIWTNGKITYVPFGTAYFDEETNGDFEFKLNASKAGGNSENIKVYAQPIFN